MEIIYPDFESARIAMERLGAKVRELEEEFGASLETDDSCVSTYYTCRYFDSISGGTRKLTYPS